MRLRVGGGGIRRSIALLGHVRRGGGGVRMCLRVVGPSTAGRQDSPCVGKRWQGILGVGHGHMWVGQTGMGQGKGCREGGQGAGVGCLLLG